MPRTEPLDVPTIVATLLRAYRDADRTLPEYSTARLDAVEWYTRERDWIRDVLAVPFDVPLDRAVWAVAVLAESVYMGPAALQSLLWVARAGVDGDVGGVRRKSRGGAV